jgi:hypothetical protein
VTKEARLTAGSVASLARGGQRYHTRNTIISSIDASQHGGSGERHADVHRTVAVRAALTLVVCERGKGPWLRGYGGFGGWCGRVWMRGCGGGQTADDRTREARRRTHRRRGDGPATVG